MSARQKDMIEKFVLDLRIGKAGKKVGEKRLASYLQAINRLHGWFEIDIDRISEQQATQFYVDLQDDKIRKMNGMPFAAASKDEFVKALKRYLGWAWGGKSKRRFQKTVSWMASDI